MYDRCKLCGQSKFLNFMGLCKRCGKDPKAHAIMDAAVEQRRENLAAAAVDAKKAATEAAQEAANAIEMNETGEAANTAKIDSTESKADSNNAKGASTEKKE